MTFGNLIMIWITLGFITILLLLLIIIVVI